MRLSGKLLACGWNDALIGGGARGGLCGLIRRGIFGSVCRLSQIFRWLSGRELSVDWTRGNYSLLSGKDYFWWQYKKPLFQMMGMDTLFVLANR